MSEQIVTGVASVHGPEWLWDEVDYGESIDLTCIECHLENDDSQDVYYDMCDGCDMSHEYLIGSWRKDSEGLYEPDPDGEYSAIVRESVVQVVYSRWVQLVWPTSPCFPGQGDLDSQANEGATRELGLGDVQALRSAQDNGKFFVGTGCDRCFQTGYRGRTGIYEMMLINEETQELIYKRKTAGTIKKLALESGMQTLRMDGARKVLAGITTISEVLRVTQTDVM